MSQWHESIISFGEARLVLSEFIKFQIIRLDEASTSPLIPLDTIITIAEDTLMQLVEDIEGLF